MVGFLAHRSDPPVHLLWSSTPIPVLGCVLGPGLDSSQNWDKRISNLSSVLDLWQQRCLSFQGKSLVANALALSGLWYTATTMILPDDLLSSVTLTLFKFIWSNKNELVSRSTKCLSKPEGGFKVAP